MRQGKTIVPPSHGAVLSTYRSLLRRIYQYWTIMSVRYEGVVKKLWPAIAMVEKTVFACRFPG